MVQTKIALYPAVATSFNDQGLGILTDVSSAVVTEKAQENGNIQNELELLYPIDGPLADDLRRPNLIRVPLPHGQFQVYEIYDYLDDDAGELTVYGQSLAYRILQFPVPGGHITASGTVQQVLDAGRRRVGDWPQWMSLTTDITDQIKVDDDFENFGAFLTRVAASVKGEVEHDWNAWRLLKHRGSQTSTILRDDKNTAGVQIKTTYDTIRNRIIPVYDDKTSGAPIDSPIAFKYYNYWRGKTVKFKDASETVDYFVKNPIDQPTLTADVKAALVDDDTNQLQLFDWVTVYNHRLNLKQSLQIIGWTWDALLQQVTDLQIGSIERNLFVIQAQQLANVDQKVDGVDQKVDKETDDRKDADKDITADTDEKIKDTNQKLQSQAEQAAEYNRQFAQQLESARQSILDVVNRNSNGPIWLRDQSGNTLTGVGPIGSITWSQGQINSSGFSWGGKLIGDNQGNFYATNIYGNYIKGLTVDAGTIKGGTITGEVYINIVGDGTWVVMSTAGISATGRNGNLNLDGTLRAGGLAKLEGGLSVNSATKLNDSLQVSGWAQFYNSVNMSNGLSVDSGTTYTQTLRVSGGLYVNGTKIA